MTYIIIILIIIVVLLIIFIYSIIGENKKPSEIKSVIHSQTFFDLPTKIKCFILNVERNNISEKDLYLHYVYSSTETCVILNKQEGCFYKTKSDRLDWWNFNHDAKKILDDDFNGNHIELTHYLMSGYMMGFNEITEDLIWDKLNEFNIFKDRSEALEKQLNYLTDKMKNL